MGVQWVVQTLPIAQASHQGKSTDSSERLMLFDSNFWMLVRRVTTKSKIPQKMQKPLNATISEELTEVELLTPKLQIPIAQKTKPIVRSCHLPADEGLLLGTFPSFDALLSFFLDEAPSRERTETIRKARMIAGRMMMTKSIALTAPPSIIPYQNKRSRTSAMIPADKMAEIGFELLLLSSTMKLPFKPLLTNFGFCD